MSTLLCAISRIHPTHSFSRLIKDNCCITVLFTPPLNTAACVGVHWCILKISTHSHLSVNIHYRRWRTGTATCDDITTIDKHKCTSFIINHCQLFHPNNIQYTSIINICCCVSLGGHAASNKRHSLSVIVVVGHHTIIHLTFASTKQHLI